MSEVVPEKCIALDCNGDPMLSGGVPIYVNCDTERLYYFVLYTGRCEDAFPEQICVRFSVCDCAPLCVTLDGTQYDRAGVSGWDVTAPCITDPCAGCDPLLEAPIYAYGDGCGAGVAECDEGIVTAEACEDCPEDECTPCSEVSPVDAGATFDVTWEVTDVFITGEADIDAWFKGPTTVNGITRTPETCNWEFEEPGECGDPAFKKVVITTEDGPMPGQYWINVQIDQGAILGPSGIRLNFKILCDCSGSIGDPIDPFTNLPGIHYTYIGCISGNNDLQITGTASVTINNNEACC